MHADDQEANGAPMVEIFGGIFALLLVLFLLMNLFSQAALIERLEVASDEGLYRVGWGASGAGFVVLKSLDLPSILIETGFLSNPSEAKLLATSRHQRRIAGAIAKGIQRYLFANPPQGTLLASLQENGVLRYVIRRGDTLSEIAQRNRVPIARIKALNRIAASDHIQIGQVLLIPFAKSGGS